MRRREFITTLVGSRMAARGARAAVSYDGRLKIRHFSPQNNHCKKLKRAASIS